MDKTAERELLLVDEEWSIPHLLTRLEAAIRDTGPALAFSPTSRTTVPSDCAVVISTSGSTGSAKEVALSGSALIASARAAHQRIGGVMGDRWSLLLPITHIAGVNVLVRSILLGTHPVEATFDSAYQPADLTSIVPTQLHRALTGDDQLLHHLQSAKCVLVGGAASSKELIAEAISRGVRCVTTYGMTEMSGGCVYDGHPLDGVEMKIDQDGRVCLRGPMQASGYLNDPEGWAKATQAEWFLTNDLGRIENGMLEILGRSDDLINSGGEKVSLGLIERLVTSHFNKQGFIAFALPDAEWGERLCLASDASMDITSIRDLLRTGIGPHAVPKDFFIVDHLPRMGIGKPDRKRLIALINTSEGLEPGR